MAAEGENKNPQNASKKSPRSAIRDVFLSPGFRSAAAMAGWDEEALLLVVEDTPVRESKHKKRLKSPPTTNSNSMVCRKRRSKRQQPLVLRLDDDDEDEEAAKKVPNASKAKELDNVVVEKEESGKGLPCMDKLREELSCAICLEICFEPSTTPCGHSFCKKCLKCAATKCGKRCPKCRQLISNGRACTINTVLWNTIQLLFPEEVEARKANACCSETKKQSPDKGRNETRRNGTFRTFTRESSQETERDRITTIGDNARNGSFRTAAQVARDVERDRSAVRRRERPSQSEDAALALRLQREEFNETGEGTRQTVYSARANLRAIYQIRNRGRY